MIGGDYSIGILKVNRGKLQADSNLLKNQAWPRFGDFELWLLAFDKNKLVCFD